MLLIGICGQKGVGKDTLGDYIIQKYNCKQYAFAYPLKKLIKDLFELSDDQLYGSTKEIVDERWNTTPRKLMQYIGTELFRNQLKNLIPELNFENLWIRKFNDWYAQNKHHNIIISDIRFKDEMEAIKKNGGIIFKVDRKLPYEDNHASELFFKEVVPDFVLDNNSTKEHLYEQFDNILKMNSNLN